MLSSDIQHQEFEPPRELRDAIKCFWYNSRDLGEDESGFEVVPDGFAEIIFHFGNGCGIASGGGLQLLSSPFMIGLLNHPVHFYSKNRLEVIGIRCYPWTVFDLLGLPTGKDGIRVFEHPIAKLQSTLEELVAANKIEQAIDQLKQYFRNARLQVTGDGMLSKAGEAMRDANGTLPVSQVAEAANATVRTLERKFRESSGYTVKDVSGLIRFEQVRNHLWLDPDVSLAGLAHEFGYTDQSHLSKEFKRYSGTTPAAFARNAKKFPVVHDFIAFKQVEK
ncbi:AraC family transcriptional regulator [Dyadobacter sp. NIV53]|uniref:helix-turn-helix domain-containing protein n=1 Tax=Dyadobacter sp. NIV53 TaxID=2861765 RepID=UPI001E362217|nr:helix-turn-helix domain-containing protein [Dyadobacter sp. NIV53]